jgi:hypothetical protein
MDKLKQSMWGLRQYLQLLILASLAERLGLAGLTSSALVKEVASMRRIIMMVVVALVMAAMMLAMAMPVFAAANHPTYGQCHKGINEGRVVGPHSDFNEQNNPIKSNVKQPGVRIACQLL